MDQERHLERGDKLGNSNQPEGRHTYGVGFIPLGNRNRASFDSSDIPMVEDREDNDPNIRFRRR